MQDKINAMENDLKTMPTQTEEQKFNRDRKDYMLFQMKNSLKRFNNSELYEIEKIQRYYNESRPVRDKQQSVLDQLEYPVKVNDSGFTEQDRVLLRDKIIALDEIQMNYYDELRVHHAVNEIAYSLSYVRHRENFGDMKQFRDAYGPINKSKVDEQGFEDQWNSIANEEFKKALERAQKYAQNLLGQQTIENHWEKHDNDSFHIY